MTSLVVYRRRGIVIIIFYALLQLHTHKHTHIQHTYNQQSRARNQSSACCFDGVPEYYFWCSRHATYELDIFCITDSSQVQVRERWQNTENYSRCNTIFPKHPVEMGYFQNRELCQQHIFDSKNNNNNRTNQYVNNKW